MDYQDVYYVDERNAAPRVLVHDRVGSNRVPIVTTRTREPAVASAPLVPATLQYQYPPQGFPTPPAVTQGWSGYPLYPQYVNPPPMGMPMGTSNLASIIGGFGDLGGLANIAAQIFAALLPLPAAPTPQDDNDVDPSRNAQNNSSNLIRYQSALALFARRDQQILTVGSVLKELFKRPGAVMG